MRLGGYWGAERIDELEPLCDKLDAFGLSAIAAPTRIMEMSEKECTEFGNRACDLGIVVGETGLWENLLTADRILQTRRIERMRELLKKADAMRCHCVASCVGTKDSSDNQLAPHPYLFTEECKSEFREVALRILDGLDLEHTRYVIEPYNNTFFYQPENILEFINSVDHPMFGLHLDQMNMINHENFYRTTELINTTFELLQEIIVSVHLKDIYWDFSHMFLKWDEVHIGDGVMDYDTYLTQLAKLPSDTPCYCEHMDKECEYALNFARLHHMASKAGVRFLRRNENLIKE